MHSDYLIGYSDCLKEFEQTLSQAIKIHNNGKTVVDTINILNSILEFYFIKSEQMREILDDPPDAFTKQEETLSLDRVLYVIVDNTKQK